MLFSEGDFCFLWSEDGPFLVLQTGWRLPMNRFQRRTRLPAASCPTCPDLQDLTATGADSGWDPGKDLAVLVFRDHSYPRSQSDLHYFIRLKGQDSTFGFLVCEHYN